MTRYTINIGNDFPIGDDDDKPAHGDGRRRGPRFGTVVRILFAVSLIGIVIHHPFQIALITGLILLVRRHPRFLELRSRLRGMGGMRAEWMRHRAERHARNDNGQRHSPRHGRNDKANDRDNDHGGDRGGDRGYGAFV